MIKSNSNEGKCLSVLVLLIVYVYRHIIVMGRTIDIYKNIICISMESHAQTYPNPRSLHATVASV